MNSRGAGEDTRGVSDAPSQQEVVKEFHQVVKDLHRSALALSPT